VSERPVLYLDVDGTLLCFPSNRSEAWWRQHKYGIGMDNIEVVLREMREHCEVRWLTFWAPGGVMSAEGEALLAKRLGVPLASVQGWDNPRGWCQPRSTKTDGIDWTEDAAGRSWVWIEDELLDREHDELRQRHSLHRFFRVVGDDPRSLQRAWDAAKEVPRHQHRCRVAVRGRPVRAAWWSGPAGRRTLPPC
jgi:hypothetical protein